MRRESFKIRRKNFLNEILKSGNSSMPKAIHYNIHYNDNRLAILEKYWLFRINSLYNHFSKDDCWKNKSLSFKSTIFHLFLTDIYYVGFRFENNTTPFVFWGLTPANLSLMTKPTKWPVRPAKTQVSLGIRSESSLSEWRNLGSLFTHWAHI